jgi:hypothetical protein
MEQAAAPGAAARRNWSDLGLALAVILCLPLAMIVEYLGLVMAENSATLGEMSALSLFAVPLVTTWGAIAISLASRAPWLRIAVAAILLLVPPILLFGAFNG